MADSADLILVIDAFLGTALARAIVVDRPIDRSFGDDLVDLLINGLTPPSLTGPRPRERRSARSS